MFENTRDFNHIIVSGPQRSGTRIVAKAICYDTEKIFIDEYDVNFHDFRLLQWYLTFRTNVVIQCPGLCHMLHHISTESTLVIMVRRSVEDIILSESRISWAEESRLTELHKYGYSNGIISRIKYEYWDSVQKSLMKVQYTDFDYNILVDHPLYVKNRSTFRFDQTK